jgi:hypothetical protein
MAKKISATDPHGNTQTKGVSRFAVKKCNNCGRGISPATVTKLGQFKT